MGRILISVAVVLQSILAIYLLAQFGEILYKFETLRGMFCCVVDIIGKANIENFEEMKTNIIKAIENGDIEILAREEDER